MSLPTDIVSMLPFAVFGFFAALAWLFLERATATANRAEERLDDIRDPSRRRKEEKKGGNLMSRALESTAVAMSKPLQPKDEKETNKIREKLSHAGFRSEMAPQVFWGMKVIGLVVGLMMSGGVAALSSIGGSMGLLKLVAPIGICFFFPDLAVWFIASGRKKKIFLGLPDALDLMVVCVEAGLGLDQAMRKVTEEMKKAHPVISAEFALCNLHLQMGRPRTQVLQDLGTRSGVDDLRALSSILIQADKFGSSIAQALRVQSDSMRTRRRQLAEEKAQQTAVKLIFPLVLFIFPGIFVVLVGPAAITMIREMFPAMQGGS